MDYYNMPNPYPSEPAPQNDNRNIKIIVIIAAVTVVVVAGIISFLLIYLNSRGDDSSGSTTVKTTTEQVTTSTENKAEASITVPNLKGMSKEKAIDKLSKIGIAANITEIESDKEKAGNVLNQVPGEGSAISEGDKVTLYIAKKPKQESSSKAESKSSSSSSQNSRLAGGAVYLYCIADDFVSLRTGPSVSYTELIRVPSRQSMVYLGEKSGNWYRVTYGGYTGYVSGNYVSFDPSSANNHTPDSSEQRASTTYLYCTASDFVSLRTGPAVSYTELARIPHGYSMKYLGVKKGNWYYVYYNGYYGYVSASWVSF